MDLFRNYLKVLYYRVKFKDTFIANNVFISMDSFIDRKVKLLKGVHVGSCNISSYTYVGFNSKFSNTDIGSFCSIGEDVLCGVGRHPTDIISTYPSFYTNKASGAYPFGVVENDYIQNPRTILGADVWIGSRAIIMGGLNIGTGAIIGAGAVVTKDVPPYAIVAGVPAKILKFRFDEQSRIRLIKSNWWARDIAKIQKVALISNDPFQFLDELEKL